MQGLTGLRKGIEQPEHLPALTRVLDRISQSRHGELPGRLPGGELLFHGLIPPSPLQRAVPQAKMRYRTTKGRR